MKFSSILLLSLGLVSGAAMAGGTTEAGVGGALGGVLGSVVGQQVGGNTGSAIGAAAGKKVSLSLLARSTGAISSSACRGRTGRRLMPWL